MKKKKKLPKYTNGGTSVYDESTATNKSAEGMAGQVLPWMQFATGLRDMGQSMLPRDEAGNIQGGGSKAANEWMTADHTHMINAAKQGDALGVLRESAGMGKIGRSISQIANKDQKTDGLWGKFNKAVGMPKDKELVDPNAEIQAEANKQDMLNKLQYGTFRQGGISYPTNAIPIHGNNWAVPTFPNGGRMYNPNVGIPNAEIEKQEVVNHPSGGVQSFDLNSHENATSANQINLEGGAKILSDKIKNPLTKKPFAQEAKRFDTSKEEKILNDSKATSSAKKTAELNFMTKKALFNKTFEQQEAIKMEKASKYLNKLGIHNNGGIQKYTEGGQQPVMKSAVTPTNTPVPSGYNLMANVNLNQDPTMIPEGVNIGGYNQFQKFLSSKDFVKDPRMNTNEGRKLYTDELINEFNSSDYVKKFPNNKITPESIKAIQQYHKLSDPNVSVDGWVGSQTSQMRYPSPIVNEKMTDPNKQYYEATWGNKKYRLPADKYSIDPTTKKAKWNKEDLILVNENGGVQKFKGGGKKYADSVKFEPRIAEDTGYYPIVPGTYTGYGEPVTEAIDPRFIQKNPLNDTQAELLVNSAKAYKPEQPTQDTPKGSNWKNTAYQVGTGLASNMGELYTMFKASKPVEVQKRYDYTPKLLNNTAAERAAWRIYKNTADSLKSAGLSSGQYISNLSANRARLTEQLDESRINRENVNAGIENQAQQYNIAGKYAVDDINAKNRAAKENLQLKATERMSTNFTQQSKDYRATEQERQMLPFMQKAFSDPAFQQMFAKWMASQGVA